MAIEVRFARSGDAVFLREHSRIPSETIDRKIAAQEMVVAEREGILVGYFSLEYLWSRVPLIAFARVLEEHRRTGVGQAMLRFVEDFHREQGHPALYSSSQVNEVTAQEWHRRVGFEECGIIAGINSGDIGEVFFRKRL